MESDEDSIDFDIDEGFLHDRLNSLNDKKMLSSVMHVTEQMLTDQSSFKQDLTIRSHIQDNQPIVYLSDQPLLQNIHNN